MSGVKLEGNALGTGVFTIKSPNSNTDRTFDLPDAAGTVMVSGNIPAFSAYPSTGLTLTNNTWTKVVVNTEEFDTANCFDTSTYRFTPNVAGYYQFNAVVNLDGSSVNPTTVQTAFYKNGSIYKVTGTYAPASTGWQGQLGNAALIYLNGSTDYVELYCLVSGATGGRYTAGSTITSIQGSMVRAA